VALFAVALFVAALFVAALFVAALAVAGAMPPTLDGGGGSRGQGRRRKGRNADGDRQQEQELRQGAHGVYDHFFTIAPAWQRSAAGGVREGHL
jgi:hypothetical protein